MENDSTEKNAEITNFSLSNFISQAYDSTPKTKEGYVLFSRLGESIKSFKPDFDYTDYGYKTFKQMIDAFSNEYEILDDGKPAPTYMILRKEIEEPCRKAEGIIKRMISYYGIIVSDEKEYFFSVSDIKKKCRDIRLKKGMRVRFVVVREPTQEGEKSAYNNGRAKEIEVC